MDKIITTIERIRTFNVRAIDSNRISVVEDLRDAIKEQDVRKASYYYGKLTVWEEIAKEFGFASVRQVYTRANTAIHDYWKLVADTM